MAVSTEPVTSGNLVASNKLFFALFLVTLIMGFAKFERFEMVDLSTMLFALFMVLMRIKIFNYDKGFFKATGLVTPHFQTAFFITIITWLVWVLNGYFIFDNEKRVSYTLTAVAVALSLLRMWMFTDGNHPHKAKQYRMATGSIYLLLLILLRVIKGSMPFYYEWALLMLMITLAVVDYFISNKYSGVVMRK